ncbi:MAG: efflux RND transporter permease subunit [Acidobacteria bacterium]|nr:MAG: efflux RND transporter permease subunit [Acidobacteriota bacterium]
MGLIDFSIRRPVSVFIFAVAAVVFGLVAFRQLSTDLLPDITYPSLTVRTELPGAAPVEVESLLTRPIENAVGVVNNLVRVSSSSRAGISEVTLELAWGTEMDFAALDVRERLDVLRLPLAAEPPVLLRYDPSLDPILRLGLVGGDGTDLIRLRRVAEERVARNLERLEGVAAVVVQGGLEEEIQVEIDERTLANLGLDVDRVATRLAQENVNLTGGRLRDGQTEYLVRTINELQQPRDLRQLVIAEQNGAQVRLADVARVRRGHREREIITRIDGRESVEVAIYKAGGTNTVTVSETVLAALDEVRQRLAEVDPTLRLMVITDQARYIRRSVREVLETALYGGLLAILVLFLFLRSFKATFIIGAAIPISVVTTFFFMFTSGISLNVMSLGGLTLGIGLLVDNAIVVLESIERQRDRGAAATEAARRGAGEVSRAIVASTLTSICVFLPIVFVEGVAAQFFTDQALTVTYSLLVSLIVALTVIPMLAAREGRGGDLLAEGVAVGVLLAAGYLVARLALRYQTRLLEPRNLLAVGAALVVLIAAALAWKRLHGGNPLAQLGERLATIAGRLLRRLLWLLSRPVVYLLAPPAMLFQLGFEGLRRSYGRLLRGALRHPAVTLLIALLAFASSLLLFPRLGQELVPELVQGEFFVDLELPPGTHLDVTQRRLQAIERRALELDGVAHVYAIAGGSSQQGGVAAEHREHVGQVTVILDQPFSRQREARVMDEMRAVVAADRGLEARFGRPSYFSFKTPIEIEIRGYNLRLLKALADRAVAGLRRVDGLRDVETSTEGGNPELQVRFDRARLASYGLSLQQVASVVQAKVQGTVATEIQRDDQIIDIRLRAAEEYRDSARDIRGLVVAQRGRTAIPLAAVADVVETEGPAEIRRADGERVAILTANLEGRDLASAARDIAAVFAGLELPAGFSWRMGGQRQEMETSFDSMKLAIYLAIFLVYLVMASQFESLRHPFVILFSVPLSLIGVLLTLWLFEVRISVVVLIGVVLLAGIVVNNAIVLVDTANRLRREEGMSTVEALEEAGQIRLRPILMTTATTVLGLLPMAIGSGEGAELRTPMALAVIGGLISSTLLTLVVIPVVYRLVDPGKREDPAAAGRPPATP